MEHLVRPGPGARQDHARWIADEGLPGEGQPGLGSHAIAERDEVPVLERGHPHLGFVETLRPLADDTRLGHDHEICALQGQATHEFRKVSVVPDSCKHS